MQARFPVFQDGRQNRSEAARAQAGFVMPFRVWDCAISVAAVYDRRPFISQRISAVIDRRYSAKANFKWYQ